MTPNNTVKRLLKAVQLFDVCGQCAMATTNWVQDESETVCKRVRRGVFPCNLVALDCMFPCPHGRVRPLWPLKNYGGVHPRTELYRSLVLGRWQFQGRIRSTWCLPLGVR